MTSLLLVECSLFLLSRTVPVLTTGAVKGIIVFLKMELRQFLQRMDLVPMDGVVNITIVLLVITQNQLLQSLGLVLTDGAVNITTA